MSDTIPIHITNESDFRVQETQITKCIEYICTQECGNIDHSFSVLLCGDQRMSDLNRQYRGVSAPTDVLSFTDRDIASGLQSNTLLPVSCDIVIDINQIDRQRGEYTLIKELMIVLIHGTLHALGYDHIRTQDAMLMSMKENHYQELLVHGMNHD